MDLLGSVFWTSHGKKDSSQDPLGLDFMREQLSDKLVRNLTGRTVSLIDVFWTLVFLRWSCYDSSDESVIIRNFLEWERWLKLTWARYPELYDRDSFPGIDRANIQMLEPWAPRKRYSKLLADARSQGMLGAYLRPLRRLGLVSANKMSLSERALPWVEFAGSPRNPVDGSWKSFRSTFDSLYTLNHKSFDRKFHTTIRESMPELFDALSNMKWTENETWDKAAKFLGSYEPYARLAHDFCKWSSEVRDEFNRIVFDGDQKVTNWPPLNFPIPDELKDRRWNFVRSLSGANSITIRQLVDWHREEFKDRKKDEAELWIDYVDGALVRRKYLGSASSTWDSDCRWWNAVVMMKPN